MKLPFWLERPDLGSERSDWGSERPASGFERLHFGSEACLGSERPNLGSEKPDLGSGRPDLGSERLYLRLGGGGGRTETGENCPMWNHRSSAPTGPLPKKGEGKETSHPRIAHGQRNPMPLCWCMLRCDGERGIGPERADDL